MLASDGSLCVPNFMGRKHERQESVQVMFPVVSHAAVINGRVGDYVPWSDKKKNKITAF